MQLKAKDFAAKKNNTQSYIFTGNPWKAKASCHSKKISGGSLKSTVILRYKCVETPVELAVKHGAKRISRLVDEICYQRLVRKPCYLLQYKI